MQLLQMLNTFIKECQSENATVLSTGVRLRLTSDTSSNSRPSNTNSTRGRTKDKESTHNRRSSRSLSPWSDQSSIASDQEAERISPKGPLTQAMKGVESTINQLHNLSTAVRRTGNHLRLQKADSRFNRAEHKTLEQFLKVCMLARTSQDTLERLEDESRLTAIQIRLINANLRRRNRFLYAQRHAKNLARRQEATVDIPSPRGVVEGASPEPVSSPDERSLPQTKQKTRFDESTATMLGKDAKLITSPPSGRETQVTSITSKIHYPNPPKMEEGVSSFKCPCCCQVLPRMISQGQRWRYRSTYVQPFCMLTGVQKTPY